MTVLTVLTLVYAGILVAALAASLITILVYLRRIGRTLGEAREALSEVAAASGPLQEPLERLEDELAAAADALEPGAEALERAWERLAPPPAESEPRAAEGT